MLYRGLIETFSRHELEDINTYCPYCLDGEGMTRTQLNNHFKAVHQKRMRRHPALKDYVEPSILCEVCKTEFHSFKTHNEHLKLHPNKYKCFLCPKTFATQIYCTEHELEHKSLTNCPICGKVLKIIMNVRLHFMEHDSAYGLYKCTETTCPNRFYKSNELKAHIRNVHYSHLGCPECDKTFTREYLKIHINTVHKRLPLEKMQCPHCSKWYNGKVLLNGHIRTAHTGPEVICDICGKSMKQHKLKVHQQRHGEKTLLCQFCDKKFTTKALLIEHEYTHNGKKPYACKHCGKGFSQAGSRKIHERIHTNERPFICEFCGKGFIANGLMKVHKSKCLMLQ